MSWFSCGANTMRCRGNTWKLYERAIEKGLFEKLTILVLYRWILCLQMQNSLVTEWNWLWNNYWENLENMNAHQRQRLRKTYKLFQKEYSRIAFMYLYKSFFLEKFSSANRIKVKSMMILSHSPGWNREIFVCSLFSSTFDPNKSISVNCLLNKCV